MYLDSNSTGDLLIGGGGSEGISRVDGREGATASRTISLGGESKLTAGRLQLPIW